MLGLGPIGTLKGVQRPDDAKKPGQGKKPMSSLDFDLGLSDDEEEEDVMKGAPNPPDATLPSHRWRTRCTQARRPRRGMATGPRVKRRAAMARRS